MTLRELFFDIGSWLLDTAHIVFRSHDFLDLTIGQAIFILMIVAMFVIFVYQIAREVYLACMKGGQEREVASGGVIVFVLLLILTFGIGIIYHVARDEFGSIPFIIWFYMIAVMYGLYRISRWCYSMIRQRKKSQS